MATLFISDLHLEPARPDITTQALEFLGHEARDAEALYILGDLFEAWVGDDDPEPEKRRVVAALRQLSDAGLPLYFMHGNRDFLVGERFAAESGCALLPDPTIVEFYGTPVILMHGDTLCTDDLDYQIFRRMVRGEEWQLHFLGKPVHHRLAMAQQARDASMKATGSKPAEIMDVSQETVEAVMRKHGIYTMVHGHTHRPAVHRFQVDGHPATRIVLGDWHEQGSVLRWSPSGFSLDPLPR
jgi:UDP-2,3-diacylglucosamine hydrolase